MIHYTIRENWRRHIQQKIKHEPLNARTIGHYAKSQFVGLAGEIAFARYLSDFDIDFEYVGDRCYDFDFVVNGCCIDIKSSAIKTRPGKWWNLVIPEYQQFQKAELYVATAVSDRDIWLLGWEHKAQFWEHDSLAILKKGERQGKFTVHEDCGQLNITHFGKMPDLLTFLELQ